MIRKGAVALTGIVRAQPSFNGCCFTKRDGILLRLFYWTKVHITKSKISMCTWRSQMSAAPQATFVVIPEISHSDISYILKNPAHTKHAGYGKMIV